MDPPEKTVHPRLAPSSHRNSGNTVRANTIASSSVHRIDNNSRGHANAHRLDGVREEEEEEEEWRSIREPIVGSTSRSAPGGRLSKSNLQNDNGLRRHEQRSGASAKEDASGIYSPPGSIRGDNASAEASRRGGSSFYRSIPGAVERRVPRNGAPANDGDGGLYGAHREDMKNYPKTRLPKKEKDSDLETSLGGSHAESRGRVKFAEQMFGPQPSDRQSLPEKSSNSFGGELRGAGGASSGADSGGENIFGGGSSVSSKSSIDSPADPPSYNILVPSNSSSRRWKYIKKHAALLAIFALLMIAFMVAFFAGGFHEQHQENDMKTPARGIMDNVDPFKQAAGGSITDESHLAIVNQTQLPVDWSKVPTHLRGYHSKIPEQPTDTQQMQQQLQQLQVQNEMIQIQNEIMDAQAKTIRLKGPMVDVRQQQRSANGVAADQGQLPAEAAAPEAPPPSLTEAEMEAARRKTKVQLEESRRKAAAEEEQRVAREQVVLAAAGDAATGGETKVGQEQDG